MFVLLFLAVVVGAARADISWHRPSREGLQSVRDFCSGRGPLDTAEDLFSSSFGKFFASSWSGTETSVADYDSHGYPKSVVPTSSSSPRLRASFDDIVQVLVTEACASGCPECEKQQPQQPRHHQVTMTTSAGDTITFSVGAGVAGWVLASVLGLAWIVLFGLIKTNKICLTRPPKTNASASLDLRVLNARNAFLDRVQCDAAESEPETKKPNRSLISPGGERLPCAIPHSESSGGFYSVDGTEASSEHEYSELEYRY